MATQLVGGVQAVSGRARDVLQRDWPIGQSDEDNTYITTKSICEGGGVQAVSETGRDVLQRNKILSDLYILMKLYY